MFSKLKKKDEPVQVRFLVDQNVIEERMTWKYQKLWKKIIGGEASDEDIQIFLGRFMVDEKQKYLDDDAKVIRILDELTNSEIKDTTQKFIDAFQGLIVPKVRGSASNSPSEVGQAGTLPAGS